MARGKNRRKDAVHSEVVVSGKELELARAAAIERFVVSRFWVLGMVVILLAGGIYGTGLTRTVNGLHSWAEATGLWAARSHSQYGLGYTKGFVTWAVGNPPKENPLRYVDHPQLPALIEGGFMAVLGEHDWSLRVENLLATCLGVFVLLWLCRKIYGEGVALLAGVIFGLFPITGYFGGGGWMLPVSLWATGRYLQVTGQIAGEAKKRYLIELGVALFLTVQLSWSGAFYAAAIGGHYVVLCLLKKQPWRIGVLAVIGVSVLVSIGLNFLVMAAGYGWDVEKIVNLYKWRAGSGERKVFKWGEWFSTIYRYGVANFTWVSFVVIGGFVMTRFMTLVMGRKNGSDGRERVFRFVTLFLLPGVLLTFVFKGLVFEHQYWQRPLQAFMAIGMALGLMGIVDAMRRIGLSVAIVMLAIFMGVFSMFSYQGLAAYRGQVWQSPVTIELFKKLRTMIPEDKRLLTYKDFVIKQNESKGSFYRPEYAWYLNREMDVAQTPKEIMEAIKTGDYPYYYVPDGKQPNVPKEFKARVEHMSEAELNKLYNGNDSIWKQVAASELMWRQRIRLRNQIIEIMKANFEYEYFGKDKEPGARGNTPCYIFDLGTPKN